ncbi:hypothetical protein B0J12DRAFT_157935 [Macrophomina phaseolina]|uniref:AAA+ ATPase domain-containing protein n=1 Tax=Macrophomina phaseolina TaxID=35725 RepID=A0ABQ8GSA3_9PEZI|nr:hypothetical protein B0J12DRAFT_157935 [Macrophomina phaseolina]
MNGYQFGGNMPPGQVNNDFRTNMGGQFPQNVTFPAMGAQNSLAPTATNQAPPPGLQFSTQDGFRTQALNQPGVYGLQPPAQQPPVSYGLPQERFPQLGGPVTSAGIALTQAYVAPGQTTFQQQQPAMLNGSQAQQVVRPPLDPAFNEVQNMSTVQPQGSIELSKNQQNYTRYMDKQPQDGQQNQQSYGDPSRSMGRVHSLLQQPGAYAHSGGPNNLNGDANRAEQDSINALRQLVTDLQAQITSLTAAQNSLSPVGNLRQLPATLPPPLPPPPSLPAPPQPPQPVVEESKTENHISLLTALKAQLPPLFLRPENVQDDGHSKTHFQMVISTYNSDASRWEETLIDPPDTHKKPPSAVAYRRFMDPSDHKKPHYDEVEIESPELKSLLQRTMQHVDDDLFQGPYFKEATPFPSFVYNWKSLQDATEPIEGDSEELRGARLDLKDILKAISLSEAKKMKSYFAEREQYLSTKTITFGHLWSLFQAGTNVCAKSFLDDWQIFEVQRTGYRPSRTDAWPEIEEPFDRYRYFDVDCAAYDWDGSQFRRYSYVFTVDKFDGRRPVTQLPCFPLEYHVDKDGAQGASSLKEQLIARGKKYVELCATEDSYALRRYNGLILVANVQRFPKEEPDYNDLPHTIPLIRRGIGDQDIIIDNFSFVNSKRNRFIEISENPPLGFRISRLDADDCSCQACRTGPTRSWPKQNLMSLREQKADFAAAPERLLLCPPKVLGYVPGERMWAQFRVENIYEISESARKDNADRFHTQLELDKKGKDMLLALVKHHQARRDALGRSTSADDSRELDPIEGKGKGLAILLHGPPGVGKTLTAEAVALATGKPLLPVSVAEIRTEPAEAEQMLEDIFDDASRWNAVLLVDEADVFLEERIGNQDIKRNTLVSVLLRVLEYYDGIIILTTNRISSLDVAVQSRMHFAIRYSDLTKEEQIRLFNQFLDKIRDNISNREQIDDYLQIICKKGQINGRQIRNIVSSAQALANSEEAKLSKTHLMEVFNATEQFVRDLMDLTMQRRMQNEVGR